ncbi:hypothetical protein WTH01_04190 [Weissella thailandensis]|nr:hypothetical protein WTH01_04190 [Weissella thailandensis]
MRNTAGIVNKLNKVDVPISARAGSCLPRLCRVNNTTIPPTGQAIIRIIVDKGLPVSPNDCMTNAVTRGYIKLRKNRDIKIERLILKFFRAILAKLFPITSIDTGVLMELI